MDVDVLDAVEVSTGKGDWRFVRLLRKISPNTGLAIADRQGYRSEVALSGIDLTDRYNIY
jgi:hypothetical protein